MPEQKLTKIEYVDTIDAGDPGIPLVYGRRLYRIDGQRAHPEASINPPLVWQPGLGERVAADLRNYPKQALGALAASALISVTLGASLAYRRYH